MMNRKEFIKNTLFAFGFGNLFSTFPIFQSELLAAEDEEFRLPSKVKSIIFIEMSGGMSHVDTLDPKPNGVFSTVPTKIKGVNFGEPFTQTAKHIHNLSLIRSTWSEEGDHGFGQFLLGTGYRMTEAMGFPDIPHMGSVIAYAKKGNQKGSYFPSYVTIGGRGGKSGQSGFLGIPYAGYHVGNLDEPIQHLNPSHGRYKEERLVRRKDLLSLMNAEFSEKFSSVEGKQWQSMLVAAEEFRSSKDIDAFRISLEDEKTRQRYGTTWQGKAMLLAKRLAIKEIPFIHINIGGWDTHDNNKAQITKIMKDTDQGIAALIEDLAGLGLFKQTIFVLSSEFGRTPVVGGRDGRDHYPKVWTSIVGGGPFSKGTVFGETDEFGNQILDPNTGVHVRDLVATLYQASGVDPTASLMNSFGRPFRLTTRKAKVRENLI